MISDVLKKSLWLCGKADRRTDRWLPLWMHAMDTALIMNKLRNHWLSDASVRAMAIDEDTLDSVSLILGLLHDIGKATPLFQYTITINHPILQRQLTRVGWNLPKKEDLFIGKTPHALAGEAIIRYIFEKHDVRIPSGIAAVIGAHHGKPQSKGDWYSEQIDGSYAINLRGRTGDDSWEDTWEEWIRSSIQYAGIDNLDEIKDINMRAQMVLSGLLIMADWIASNTHYFPLIEAGEIPKPDIYPERANRAWKKLNLPPVKAYSSVSMTTELFSVRFGFKPNGIQQSMIEAVEASSSPGIYILEAQMGIGKTEAALSAAEILRGKYACSGVFFGLPTQATANGIFKRLLNWAENQSDEEVSSIRLAHGMADFNEDYRALFTGLATVNEDEINNSVIVHDWFRGRKTALLADFVIGTIDQLLMAALQQKHLMLRHLGLSGKIIVIDECHAYDAYMSTYLERMLRWLGAYGLPVIVLSATLPAEKRFSLIKSYTGSNKLSSEESWVRTLAYPLLTWSDGGEVMQRRLKDREEAVRKVTLHYCEDEQVITTILDYAANGSCVGIIVNTVKRAQDLYCLLNKASDESTIILYHAQFAIPDRIIREKEILKRVGKESTQHERNRVIIIGTQVLEQSLDIDFDVLFTDLCPMDLLLQRSGRLHRHSGRLRSKKTETPQLYVLKAEGELDEGAVSVYGSFLLLRTKELLKTKDAIFLPVDIPELVQRAYDYNENVGAVTEEYIKAKDVFLSQIKKKESKAAVYLLGEPDMKKEYNRFHSITGIIDRPEINDQRAAAAVRDGNQSIEVLVLQKKENGSIHFLPWQEDGREIPTDHVPDNEECLLIAKQRLRLPSALCKEYNIDHTISTLESVYESFFEEWKDSAWLCNELILLLDESGCSELGGFRLKYDYEKGLQTEKME